MRQTYTINIDEAEEAWLIEAAVAKIPGVTAVSVSFLRHRLYLEAAAADFKKIANSVAKTAQDIAPDFAMTVLDGSTCTACGDDEEEEGGWGERTLPYRVVAAFILLVVGTVLEYFCNWTGLPLYAVYGTGLLIVGADVFVSVAVRIWHLQPPDEKLLMSIASLGAFAIGQCPEALAVMLFYQFGEILEDRAVDRSRRSIKALMDIQPQHATVLRDGQPTTVNPADVNVGETVVVKPGERIPLDGTVVAGDSYADTSALTGESVPRHLREGEPALSGCINTTATVKIQVTKPYADSTVARILALIEDSAARKSSSERFITKFAHYYTPAVVAAALAVAFLPDLLWPADWATWLYRGLIFLVVSCPCALVVSVPLSCFCGLGCASKHGILIKGSNYLEALAKADVVVFDKTGTLTTGEFAVHHVHPVGMSRDELVDLAAGAEFYSDHPISASIQHYAGHGIAATRVGESQNVAGKGVRTFVDGKEVNVGNQSLMADIGVTETLTCGPTGTNVHVSVDRAYAGHIVISDRAKPDSIAAVRALHAEGIRQVRMLTGDSRPVAAAVAGELGLDGYDAELLPDGKTARLEELIAAEPKGRTVVYVGDGINDAPALALADVGVAMGCLGADAAIESADVVVMDDSPAKVATGVRIAKHTERIVKENIVFALAVKFGVLFLTPLGLTNMWLAIFADVGVLIIAVLNAVRALRIKEPATDATPAMNA